MEKIADNIILLGNYPQNDPLMVNFSELESSTTAIDVYNHFKNRVSGIINAVMLKNGSGYVVVSGKSTTEALLKLERDKVGKN